jgi:hypothetical protein
MLECLVSLIVMVLVAVIILWVIETAVKAFSVTVPPAIWTLLRLLAALLILIEALSCFFGGGAHVLRFPLGRR